MKTEMIAEDDWRRQGQERYLMGIVLVQREYRMNPTAEAWDHDHCEFCGIKFSTIDDPRYRHEGYATEDEYCWICRGCFDDFRDEYQWKVGDSKK